jgi:uncharacterized protein with NRDE domain
MCLIVFAWKSHPGYELILAANRDEFLDRPALPARFWPEFPEILAGKDLKEGGTWMGVDVMGRFSAVTNYREIGNIKKNAASRGSLPLNYLAGEDAPGKYLSEIDKNAMAYNGFNLLTGNTQSLWYYSNVTRKTIELDPGIFGLSNHLLDTPWFKVKRSREVFEGLVSDGEPDDEKILAMLSDPVEAPESKLPDTGLEKEVEKKVSAAFISMENYGTRCSTILRISKDGYIDLRERQYDNADRNRATDRHYRFRVGEMRS